ncbi:hypothetical protein Gotur_033953, partial [Gossypium turneri]
ERFALEVSDNYVKKALGKNWRDHKSALKKEYFKKNISLEEKFPNVPQGILRIMVELELQVGKNKNSCTQVGRKVLLVKLMTRNYRLVKKLDSFSFLTLHIESKIDLL